MNADKLTGSMDSTTNAKGGTVSAYGRNSRTYLTACQLQHSLMTRYSACMVAFHQSSSPWHNCNRSLGRQKFLRMASYVTYFGLIQRRPRAVGEKTIEASAIHLVKLSSSSSWRRMTSIWFVERTKSSRMVMNSSAVDNSSQCSQLQTIVENSIIREHWCP